ncbi:MAG: universal stress protein [Syntrophales bacterium]|nr:universal stress protein [Syntrophales bacterium]
MYQKILVPLDGSKVAEEVILPHVRSVAEEGRKVGEMILLQVIETPPAWVMEGSGFQESHEAQKKTAKEYLSKIQSQLNLEGVNVTSEVLVGNAAETIIDFAKQKKVNLILMTTNVSSTISQLIIGSVANKVMRYSRIPVLMVRPAATEC